MTGTRRQDGASRTPDLGAVRAAGLLTERLGIPVSADGVAELGRQGLIPVTGSYKSYPLYDGRVLESFADAGAAAEATRAGELRTADQAAAYLRIRRADLDHLTRAGLLDPARWGRGPFDRRGTPTVPLYRTADLDDLADDAPGIDWDAVRATRRDAAPRSPACPTRRNGAGVPGGHGRTGPTPTGTSRRPATRTRKEVTST